MFIVSKCTIKKTHITNYKQHILFLLYSLIKKHFRKSTNQSFPIILWSFQYFSRLSGNSSLSSKSRYSTVYVTPRENVQSQKLKFGLYSKFIGSKQLKGISNILPTIDIMQFKANPIENTK